MILFWKGILKINLQEQPISSYFYPFWYGTKKYALFGRLGLVWYLFTTLFSLTRLNLFYMIVKQLLTTTIAPELMKNQNPHGSKYFNGKVGHFVPENKGNNNLNCYYIWRFIVRSFDSIRFQRKNPLFPCKQTSSLHKCLSSRLLPLRLVAQVVWLTLYIICLTKWNIHIHNG